MSAKDIDIAPDPEMIAGALHQRYCQSLTGTPWGLDTSTYPVHQAWLAVAREIIDEIELELEVWDLLPLTTRIVLAQARPKFSVESRDDVYWAVRLSRAYYGSLWGKAQEFSGLKKEERVAWIVVGGIAARKIGEVYQERT